MVECFGYFLKVIRMTSVKVGTNIVVPSNFLHCFQLYNLYMMNEKCHISNVYKVINPATSPRKSSLNLKSFFPPFLSSGLILDQFPHFHQGLCGYWERWSSFPRSVLATQLGFLHGWISESSTNQKKNTITRWWFQIFSMFIPTWGRFPIWLIFFRWVETTN